MKKRSEKKIKKKEKEGHEIEGYIVLYLKLARRLTSCPGLDSVDLDLSRVHIPLSIPLLPNT